MDSKPQQIGAVAEWFFFEWEGHPFTGEFAGRPLYGFTAATVGNSHSPRVTEWHPSIEHAMAAAIAEKFTGPRGAGGSGVGTAADWFMRMIGADGPEPMPCRCVETTQPGAVRRSFNPGRGCALHQEPHTKEW